MARLTFPDEGSRLVYRTSGSALTRAVGASVEVYSDAGATTLADIQTVGGATIVGSVVTSDAYSRIPLFLGPDGADTVYVVISGGPITAVYARADDRIDANTTLLTSHTASIAALPGTYALVVRGTLVSQMLTDGSDQTTTANAELAALYAAGGGTWRLPVGTVRINSQLTMPHDSSTIWMQPPIRIVGGGHRQDGHWSGLDTLPGGTVLDLRYAGRTDAGCGTTNGSPTVTDAAITAADYGTGVTGPGIPAGSYVGTVTPGASFLLSSTSGLQTNVNATATATVSVVVLLPKILTLGRGTLKAGDLCLYDGGTSSNPFLLTTNTTLKFRDMAVIGNPSKSGATCDQDPFILGGTTASYGNLVSSGFQGYGSVFDGMRFSRVRRGFYLKTSCNSNMFNHNVWDTTCGGITAFEIDGMTDQARGNSGIGNLIEMTNYVYGFTVAAAANTFYGTAFWDRGGSTVAELKFPTAGANGNEFLGTFGVLNVENPGNAEYTLTGNSRVRGSWRQDGVLITPFLTPASPSTSYIIGSARSSSDPSNPGRGIFSVNYNGVATLLGTGAAAPQMIMLHQSSGQTTIDHQSIVRDTGDLQLYAGGNATDRVRIARGKLRIDNGLMLGGSGVSHYSGTGVPAIAGAAGDWFWRQDTPTVATQRAYICTVAGIAGAATWVGII